MPRRIITLTTDFGIGSHYVAAMRGVILSINPEVNLVEISHSIAPQDVAQGALVLADTTPYFPPRTIHVAVVDPGVGTERKLVWCRIGEQEYIGPDNGLFSLVAQQAAPHCIVALDRPEYWLPHVSNTFHGRDIMAPVAARLSLGLEPRFLGTTQEKLVELPCPAVARHAKQLAGTILFVDAFGNLMTNISATDLAAIPDRAQARVICGQRTVSGIAGTYGERARGELVALVGSTGRLEIAVVAASAARELGASVGDSVVVTWA